MISKNLKITTTSWLERRNFLQKTSYTPRLVSSPRSSASQHPLEILPVRVSQFEVSQLLATDLAVPKWIIQIIARLLESFHRLELCTKHAVRGLIHGHSNTVHRDVHAYEESSHPPSALPQFLASSGRFTRFAWPALAFCWQHTYGSPRAL